MMPRSAPLAAEGLPVVSMGNPSRCAATAMTQFRLKAACR